jgi:hypothetical protein
VIEEGRHQLCLVAISCDRLVMRGHVFGFIKSDGGHHVTMPAPVSIAASDPQSVL